MTMQSSLKPGLKPERALTHTWRGGDNTESLIHCCSGRSRLCPSVNTVCTYRHKNPASSTPSRLHSEGRHDRHGVQTPSASDITWQPPWAIVREVG